VIEGTVLKEKYNYVIDLIEVLLRVVQSLSNKGCDTLPFDWFSRWLFSLQRSLHCGSPIADYAFSGRYISAPVLKAC
jgi:hypothetical protein